MLGQPLLAAGVAVPLLLASPYARSSPISRSDQCVVIDNDYDIDDMMAIPLVIANRRVAAIVQTEGYTIPTQAAPAAAALVHGERKPSAPRGIPILVGGSQRQAPDPRQWPWMPFFRAMMNRANGLLAVQPQAWPEDPAYPQKLQQAVADCGNVTVLLTAPFTSFMHYAPLIRQKLNRVVITGQPISGQLSAVGDGESGGHSFNCFYDLLACAAAMQQLKPSSTFFVDLPGGVNCDAGIEGQESCYAPTYAMVAGVAGGKGAGSRGLMTQGLPGRLRRALINPIRCSSFYTTPQSKGRPCSSLSTWVPAAVAKGPGGKMLLWDQTTALFLIDPGRFSRHSPGGNVADPSVHYEPKLVAGSHAKTAMALRSLWTEATNRSAWTMSPESAQHQFGIRSLPVRLATQYGAK
jgi:hypothetical protein